MGIRVKILLDYIYIMVKEPGKDWSRCLVNQIKDPSYHYMTVVGSNKKEEEVTWINLNALTFKNLDPDVYQD